MLYNIIDKIMKKRMSNEKRTQYNTEKTSMKKHTQLDDEK